MMDCRASPHPASETKIGLDLDKLMFKPHSVVMSRAALSMLYLVVVTTAASSANKNSVTLISFALSQGFPHAYIRHLFPKADTCSTIPLLPSWSTYWKGWNICASLSQVVVDLSVGLLSLSTLISAFVSSWRDLISWISSDGMPYLCNTSQSTRWGMKSKDLLNNLIWTSWLSPSNVMHR